MEDDVKIVKYPSFELVDCPTINLQELREKGLDCPIRNEAVIDGKLVTFAPPTTIRRIVDDLATLLQVFEDRESDIQ
jgi:hypothetical protein